MAEHPQDDLPGLLLGELPPATAVAVDHHLAGCDPCRRDLAAVAVAASALRDASRLPFTEAGKLPALRTDLDGQAAPPTPGWHAAGRRGVPRWLLRAAAVLIALLLGLGGLILGRDRVANGGQTVTLAAPAGVATAEAHMRGSGDQQVMTMTARDLPRPSQGAYYEVWLVDDRGGEFPVGLLAPTGEGIWTLPTAVAARYRAIHVTLEPDDGNPARSPRTVLHGAYA